MKIRVQIKIQFNDSLSADDEYTITSDEHHGEIAKAVSTTIKKFSADVGGLRAGDTIYIVDGNEYAEDAG